MTCLADKLDRDSEGKKKNPASIVELDRSKFKSQFSSVTLEM